MALVHPRTAIRGYTKDLIEDKVDVAAIYMNRPNTVQISELPCICIYFNAETADVVEGDNYIPHMYDRSLNISIDILAEQPNDPDQELEVETKLDTIARHVERALFNDRFFQHRLDDYTDRNSRGLLAGMRLLSTIPDSIETGSDTRLACQNIVYTLIYNDPAFMEARLDDFTEYEMKMNRVGWDDDTVDPTLIEASGTISE